MSRDIARTEFTHANDCCSTGCPGHVLTIEYCNSTYTATVKVDDEVIVVWDEGLLTALTALNTTRL